jgi:hypothetical protein
MVVYTGRGLPPELAARHPHVTVLRKPESHKRLLAELAAARGKVLPEWDRQGGDPPLCSNDVTRRDNLGAQSMQHTVSTI